MKLKKDEKKIAIELRRRGFSYTEILEKISVAKSTLSLWLRSVKLSKQQKQRLTSKKIASALRGAQQKKAQRLAVSEDIIKQAKKEIRRIDLNTVKLLGAFLYWAEGNKQKWNNVSVGVKFSNSDPLMINFFYKWLIEICHVRPQEIYFELYIHETADIDKARKFWLTFLSILSGQQMLVRLKKNKFNKYRKNTGKDYNGLVRINVRRSTNLNRKIMGWVEGAYEKFC